MISEMGYYLLPIFYIFSSLVPQSKLPILPISDVDVIVVEVPNVKCVSGCDLVEADVENKIFKCLKVDAKEISANDIDPGHLTTLSSYHYQCTADVLSSENVNFNIR